MDKRDERILRILQSDDTGKTHENLEKYLDYLKKNLSSAISVLYLLLSFFYNEKRFSFFLV